MNRFTLKPGQAAVTALGLVLVGAAVMFAALRLTGGREPNGATSTTRPPDATAAPSSTIGMAETRTRADVRVSIPDELVQRAHIALGSAVAGGSPATIRVPAVVEPNA